MRELDLTPKEEANNALVKKWIVGEAQDSDESEIRSRLWDLWFAGSDSPFLVFTEIQRDGKKHHFHVEQFFLEDFTEDVPDHLLNKYVLVWLDPETGEAW